MNSTKEQRAEWKRLSEAATPGPWIHGAILERVEDAAFIAASRTAVPQLLADVERLEAQLAAADALAGKTCDLMSELYAADVTIAGLGECAAAYRCYRAARGAK